MSHVDHILTIADEIKEVEDQSKTILAFNRKELDIYISEKGYLSKFKEFKDTQIHELFLFARGMNSIIKTLKLLSKKKWGLFIRFYAAEKEFLGKFKNIRELGKKSAELFQEMFEGKSIKDEVERNFKTAIYQFENIAHNYPNAEKLFEMVEKFHKRQLFLSRNLKFLIEGLNKKGRLFQVKSELKDHKKYKGFIEHCESLSKYNKKIKELNEEGTSFSMKNLKLLNECLEKGIPGRHKILHEFHHVLEHNLHIAKELYENLENQEKIFHNIKHRVKEILSKVE